MPAWTVCGNAMGCSGAPPNPMTSNGVVHQALATNNTSISVTMPPCPRAPSNARKAAIRIIGV